MSVKTEKKERKEIWVETRDGYIVIPVPYEVLKQSKVLRRLCSPRGELWSWCYKDPRIDEELEKLGYVIADFCVATPAGCV